MSNKLVGSIVKIIISFSLIGLLLFIMRKQLVNIWQLLLNIKVTLLIIAILFSFIGHVCISVRLKLFLAAQKILINLKEAIGLTLIGYFFNNFLPTAVGGDVVKAYYVSKKTEGRLHSFTSVFMDRFVGSFALVFLALFAFVLLRGEIENKIIIWPIWVLFFGAIVFLLMFFNKKFMKRISKVLSYFKILELAQKVHSSLLAFKVKKALFLKTFLISLVAQCFSFIAVYFLIKGLYDFVPFIKVLLIMPLICIASMFPSINGLGIREGAFLLFFRPLIGADKAFTLSLLWLFIYISLGIFGGFIYAFARHGKISKK